MPLPPNNRVADIDFWFFTSEEIEARRLPYSKDKLVLNISTGELRIGPGNSFAECRLVATFGSGAESVAAETLLMKGAGTQVVERWVRDGALNGKARYLASGSPQVTAWNGSEWQIGHGAVVRYSSTENTATPDQVVHWTHQNGSLEPGPTIFRLEASTLQMLLEAQGWELKRQMIARGMPLLDHFGVEGPSLRIQRFPGVILQNGDGTVEIPRPAFNTIARVTITAAFDSSSIPMKAYDAYPTDLNHLGAPWFVLEHALGGGSKELAPDGIAVDIMIEGY